GRRRARRLSRRRDRRRGRSVSPKASHWGRRAGSPPEPRRHQTTCQGSSEARTRRPASWHPSREVPYAECRRSQRKESRSRPVASLFSRRPPPDPSQETVEDDQQNDSGQEHRGPVELVDEIVEGDGAKVVRAQRRQDESNDVREESQRGRGEGKDCTHPGGPCLQLGV